MKIELLIIPVLLSSCGMHEKNHSMDSIRFPERGPAYFAVHIDSDDPVQGSMSVVFWCNDLLDSVQYFSVDKDKKGSYYFILPPFNFASRIELFHRGLSPGNIIDRQLVMPGDSIHIWIRKNSNDSYSVNFTGRGAEKFRCVNAMTSLKQRLDESWRKVQVVNGAERRIESPDKLFNETEGILRDYLQILDGYRDELSPGLYSILRADLIGYVRHQQMKIIATAYSEVNPEVKPAYEHALESVLFGNTEVSDTTVLTYSADYRDYIYERYKLRYLFQRNRNFDQFDMVLTSDFSCRELYEGLKSDFSGTLREKLMAHFFVYSRDLTLFFAEKDEDAFMYCLKDGIGLIHTPFLKRMIARKLNNNTQGKAAYDFALPDRDGNIIRLSDFRGKVVFIDIWGYPCSGCLGFKKKFEREIYPKVRNNQEFVFISINLSDKKSVWIDALDQYSHPDYINLAAGLGSENHLREYYNIRAVPFLMLVDRQGKIVTTTERGIGKILALINKALLADK